MHEIEQRKFCENNFVNEKSFHDLLFTKSTNCYRNNNHSYAYSSFAFSLLMLIPRLSSPKIFSSLPVILSTKRGNQKATQNHTNTAENTRQQQLRPAWPKKSITVIIRIMFQVRGALGGIVRNCVDRKTKKPNKSEKLLTWNVSLRVDFMSAENVDAERKAKKGNFNARGARRDIVPSIATYGNSELTQNWANREIHRNFRFVVCDPRRNHIENSYKLSPPTIIQLAIKNPIFSFPINRAVIKVSLHSALKSSRPGGEKNWLFSRFPHRQWLQTNTKQVAHWIPLSLNDRTEFHWENSLTHGQWKCNRTGFALWSIELYKLEAQNNFRAMTSFAFWSFKLVWF